MGVIYKITNTCNNKVYIGQTVKTMDERWRQHHVNYNKPYFSHLPLYRAMNKYGPRSFICEQLEEVPDNELDEREKYWIKYYNSYETGYNATLGGRATPLYEWDVEDILERYHRLKSARKVALELGCDHASIDDILNANNVKRYTPAQQQSKPVKIEKNGQVYCFETTTDAAHWLMDNGHTRNYNYKSVRQEITNAIRKNKKYLGFTMNYL